MSRNTAHSEAHARSFVADSVVAVFLDRQSMTCRDPALWEVMVLETWDYTVAARKIRAVMRFVSATAETLSVDEVEHAFRRRVRQHYEDREDALERWRMRAGIAWAEQDGIARTEAIIAQAGQVPACTPN